MTIEHLLTAKCLAERIGVTESCLAKWRLGGDKIPYISVGLSIMYDPRDVQSWLDAHRVSSTSQQEACMMDNLANKKGTVHAALCNSPTKGLNPYIYPLPSEYHKEVRFSVGTTIIAVKGGRALALDRLITAGPKGIDRAATLQWIANISDTIGALKGRGIEIETRKGHAANYVLRCSVKRWEDRA